MVGVEGTRVEDHKAHMVDRMLHLPWLGQGIKAKHTSKISSEAIIKEGEDTTVGILMEVPDSHSLKYCCTNTCNGKYVMLIFSLIREKLHAS